MIYELKNKGEDWKLVEIFPRGNIKLFTKNAIAISVVKEDKHFSSYKIKDKDTVWLLHIIHLTSAMNKDEEARNRRADKVSDLIRKLEEYTFKTDEYKSIIVGDFNLQPYSRGIAGIFGFNATMSIPIAKKEFRSVEGEKRFYYYNPMWKLMGDNKLVQGTYYVDSDQQDLSMFWYSFDEVLIRPYFIDRFNWEYFGLVEKTEMFNLIKDYKINKTKFSDHLPLKFEII